jgi:ABC-type transport system involved in cytochrome bd biosynthesis fused ATPase/permease subunit
VCLDGTDLRDVTLASLADAVGLVAQETYLLHASIRENLLLAKPDASVEELDDVIRAARLDELVATLPDGMEVLREDSARREAWLAGAMATALTPAEQGIVAIAAELLDRLADE